MHKLMLILLCLLGCAARAGDILDPEFHPPLASNLVERATAHAGEPAGGADEGGWELIWPKTTAAIGGILGALGVYWSYNNIDVADSNGGPDADAAAALEAEKERQAQAQAGGGGKPQPLGDALLLINGTFTGSPEVTATGVFTASLTLTSSQAGAGTITAGARSDGAAPQVNGTWTGGYGNEIVLRTNDPAYTGIATVEGGALVINGRRLFAAAGAQIVYEQVK